MNFSLCAVFHGPGRDLEMRHVSLTQPSGGEILVRVLGCTLCGSDLHTFDGRRDTPVPTILGHEIVGEIESIGEDAPRHDMAGRKLNIGDRVTWSIVARCGNCFYCRRGLPQKCLTMVKYGHEPMRPGRELLGGLAGHCLLVPGTAVVRLPELLPLAVACPANCATATVAAAIRSASDLTKRNVCVFGAGMLGLTACAMAQTNGAATIVCVDVNEDRLAKATSFGATHVSTPDELVEVNASISEGHGFDQILELSGSPAAFESGWDLSRMGGTLVLVGSVFPAPPVVMSLEQIVRRNVTIRGIHNYTPEDLLTAVDFLARTHERFPFAGLVDEWVPLEDVTRAFDLSHESGRIRIGVAPT